MFDKIETRKYEKLFTFAFINIEYKVWENYMSVTYSGR